MLPRHGLKAEYFSCLKPRATAQPITRTTSKWQIHLHQWQNPHRGGCGLPQGERSVPLRGSTQRGLPSGRFFGDFLIGEKVTRGAGRSARSWGVQRGAAPRIGQQRPQGGAPASGVAGAASRDCRPARALRGGREKKRGVQGTHPLPPLALRRAVWYSF